MATPNVGILTTAGKALIDKVNSGQAKISFSKIVFSSMDNSQLSDMQVKALTAIAPQEVVVSSPETTLDTNSGETRIRATGTNEKLADGVYVKTYGVFAKDDTGSEILYGVTVSPNPNYFPAYDGVTPQAVTYSYKTVIQETSNITMTNSNDVYASQEDLTEAIAAIPKPDLSNYATNRQLATKADDSKVVHSTDMRKPASDVAGIEEVSAKQDKIGYTPADDSKVAHLSGANKFDTVPTVNNNPLLLASSLPSDLARTGSNQEFTGKNTFDVAPIDKTTGKPYITKDGVPSIPSDVARTSQQTNFTAGLKSGGVDVATAADLKSVEASAWHTITGKSESLSSYTCMYRKNNKQKYVDLVLYGTMGIGKNSYLNISDTQTELLDLKDIVSAPKNVKGMIACAAEHSAGGGATYDLEISGTKLTFAWNDQTVLSTGKRIVSANYDDGSVFMRVTFD